MNRTLLDVGAVLAAAGLFLFARHDASQAADGLPPLPVRGARITSAARVGPATEEPEPIPGNGTAAAPFELPFALFAFPEYDPPPLRPDPPPLPAAAFPDGLRPFATKVVAVEGFMLATDFDGQTLKRFMLSRFPAGCCFGGTPVLDEWIDVSLAPDGGAPSDTYSAQVRVVGTLDIGEDVAEGGAVKSLYRMTDAKFESVW